MSWLRRLRNTLRPDASRTTSRASSPSILRSARINCAPKAERGRGDTPRPTAVRQRDRPGRTHPRCGYRALDGRLPPQRPVRGAHARRTPGFAAAVILTLALGIGANTAVFSAIDAVLLQPLPFPDGDRLMRLRQTQEKSAETNIAPIRLEDWNRLNSTFEAITGYLMEDVSETSGDLPERVRRRRWRRAFSRSGASRPRWDAASVPTSTAGGPSAVLISDRYWRRRFGADPNVAGQDVRIGSRRFRSSASCLRRFCFPIARWTCGSRADGRQARAGQVRQWYTGIGRLKPGVTLEQARANLAAVQAQLGEQYPETDSSIGVRSSRSRTSP